MSRVSPSGGLGPWLALLLASCGPRGDGVVVVTVTAEPLIDGLTSLAGTVSVGSTTRPVKLDLGGTYTLPPAMTFAVDVPVDLGGSASFHLDGLDVAGGVLGSGDGEAVVSAGARVDATIMLRPPATMCGSHAPCPAGAACVGGRCASCRRQFRLGGTPPVAVGGGPVGLVALGGPLPALVASSTASNNASLLVNDLRGGFVVSAQEWVQPAGELAQGELSYYGRTVDGTGVFRSTANRRGLFPVAPASPGTGLVAARLGGGTGDDVAVGAHGAVEVLLLDGAQADLRPKVAYPVSPFDVSGLASGDVDGDGRIDLVAAAGPNLDVLRNVGDGAFARGASLDVSGKDTLGFLALADLDGDSKLDAVVGDATTRRVVVLRGRGDGSFTPPAGAAVSALLASTPGAVAIGDVTGDERLDVVALLTSDYLAVLPGGGDGTLGAPVIYAAGASPQRLVIRDLDNDGLADVAVTDLATSTVGVFYQKDGRLIPGQPGILGTPGTSWGSALADLDQDGHLDAMVSLPFGIGYFLGHGDGTFSAPRTLQLGGNTLQSPAAGDLNGDGYPELAVPSYWTAQMFVVSNRGGKPVADTTLTTVNNGVQAALADFTGDGKTDVCMLAEGVGGHLQVWTVDADGVVDAEPFDTLVSPDIGAKAMAVADLDRDGKLDAVISMNDGTLAVFAGVGDGTFTRGASYPTAPGNRQVRLADVNGDGKLDAVVATVQMNRVCVLLGHGDGTFDSCLPVATGATPAALDVGDVDGDGKVDIVTGNQTSRDWTVLLGDGRGGFGMPVSIAVGHATPTSLRLGDVNGDGLLDGLGANQGATEPTTMLVNYTGTYCVNLP